MSTNHIAPELMPLDLFGKIPGTGYGLGFSVLMDVGQCQGLGSEGVLEWGGAGYRTRFWIDPQEELIIISMSESPNSGRIADDLRVLAYGAIVN